MVQKFIFGEASIVYDTESFPLEYISLSGAKIKRPDLTYDDRRKAYAEIRETAALLLEENDTRAGI